MIPKRVRDTGNSRASIECMYQIVTVLQMRNTSAHLQVPTIRSSMLTSADSSSLAKKLKKGILAPGAATAAAQERMKSMLDAFNFMVDSSMVAENAEPQAAPSPSQTPVRLTLYRKSKAGVMEAWSDMQLAIEDGASPTNISLKVRHHSGFCSHSLQ